MSLLLKQLFGFLKLLNSETGHNQIAAGVAAGLILGMSPTLSLQALLVFLCIFFFRIQAGAAFLAAFFFAFIAYLLDPVFDSIGSQILESESLHSFFTKLYNMPIVPLTRFNNSVVMGAGIVTFLASPIVFFLSRYLILKYRETIVARIKRSQMWKLFQATSLYKWYYSYDQLFG